MRREKEGTGFRFNESWWRSYWMNFIEWTSQIKHMYDPNATLATHRNNWMNQGLADNFPSNFREVSGKLLNKFFSRKLALQPDYADIIFKKNYFVPAAATVIYLHVALITWFKWVYNFEIFRKLVKSRLNCFLQKGYLDQPRPGVFLQSISLKKKERYERMFIIHSVMSYQYWRCSLTLSILLTFQWWH